MLYLVKNGSWVMFGQVLNSILSFILLIAFANLLPKETYGTYKYILSILGVLNVCTLSGMNSAVAQAIATGREGVLRPSVTYQLNWNMLMLLSCVALGIYYIIKNDVVLAYSLFILGIFVPLTLACNTYGSYFEGKKQFRIANVLSVLSTFVYSAGILIALIYTDTVYWLILVYALTTFIPSFVFYLYTIKKYTPDIAEDIEDVKKYGRELTYLRFIDPIVSQIDKVILGSFWGAGPLAVYALASAIPAQVMYFLKDWVAIGLPKFSQKSTTTINTVFTQRILQGLGLGLCITLAYYVTSPYVFTLVLPQYIEGIFYSQVLALNFIFAIPNRYVSLLFVSQKFSKVLYTRTLIMSVASILLYVSFGITGGIMGLVIANVTNSVLGFAVNILMWKRVSVNQ